MRVSPQVIAADDSRAFRDRSPVICQVRMVNELPLVPDFERLEEMIADETTVSRGLAAGRPHRLQHGECDDRRGFLLQDRGPSRPA